MPRETNSQPTWVSPVIHVGMMMTISSVIAAQFVENAVVEFVLIAIALVGIFLSMAPFWPSSLKDLWESMRRMAEDANMDEHLTDMPHDPAGGCKKNEDDCRDEGE